MYYYKQYHYDRKDYYEQFLFPKHISDFLNLCETKDCYPSANLISFKNIPFGSPASEFEEPRIVITYSFYGNEHKVLFYKEQILHHKVVTQVHFLNNGFFYACYSFRNYNSADLQNIKKVVFDKYAGVNGQIMEKSSGIKDKNNNCLKIVSDVFLKALYLSGDENVKNSILNIIAEQQNEKERAEARSLGELYRKL